VAMDEFNLFLGWLKAAGVAFVVYYAVTAMFPEPFSWIVIGLFFLWVFRHNIVMMRIFLFFEIVAGVTFLFFNVINRLLALVFVFGLILLWVFYAKKK
jgi:hypothetical protein